VTCYEAMRLILKSGLRPKRTLRFIAWSGEEFNDPKSGHHAYQEAHLKELGKHIVALENDFGSTKLLGFGYIGDPKGKEVVKMVGDKYMSIINASLVNDAGEAVDTAPLLEKGVPTMANVIEDTPDHKYYFTYHHTAGDSMNIMNPDDMDSNVLGLAVMFYILADLDSTIPRPGLGNSHLRSN
jgi:carboxypeptidase Q